MSGGLGRVGAAVAVGAGVAAGASPWAYELRGVSRRLGGEDVLRAADAAFRSGCAHVVTGPSGAGKTTLLRLLMGLDEPDAGAVVRPEGARLAACFQEDRLVRNLTATANIRLPHGRLRAGALAGFLERERAALEAVGLPADARPVRELSGGQRRRVSILRALLADADVLFFDEPLKGMDAPTVGRLMEFARPLMEGRTVFWVTHDERELDLLGECEVWSVGGGRVLRSQGPGV